MANFDNDLYVDGMSPQELAEKVYGVKDLVQN